MTIPTCADLVGATVTDRFDDMVSPPGLTNHWAVVQVDHDVLAVRSLNVPPLSQGDCVTGRLYLDGRLAQSYGEKVEVVWRPDRVERATEVLGVRIRTVTVCPPGQPGVLVRIEVTNQSHDGPLRLGVWCDSTATRATGPWLAAEPPREGNDLRVEGSRRYGVPNGRVIGAPPGGQHERATDAAARPVVSLQGLVDDAGEDVPTEHARPRLIETTLDLAPGETWTGAYAHVLGEDDAAADAAYWAVVGDHEHQVRRSEEAWDAELAALFTPGHDLYGGHLPVLRTSDDALRRLYWWGALGVAWFRRDNPASVLGRTYDTLMPRYWQTVTFIWDYSLSSQVHALLDPAVMRRQVLHWIGLDIDRHFGTEWLTGGPVGYWYSVNHYALIRLVHDYVTLHGDDGLLDEQVTTPDGVTRSVADCLVHWARAWTRRRGESGRADYGGIDNLLECVSSYVHEVASLNAANVWCLRTVADVVERRGDQGEAGRLRAEAEALLPRVQDLYLPGEGCFAAAQPDGSRHASRHCYDLATVGTTIADDLPEQQRAEMVDFFTRELQTPSWMRALSPWDDDAGFSVRPDHQWNGAYPAWPADTARALIALGHPQVALDWLPGLARTTRQGPPGQAHMVEEAVEPVDGGARKAPPQFPYLIDWACSSAGAWCELVIGGIFGVSADADGTITADGCIGLLDPDARLEGLTVQGRVYDVGDGAVTERGA